MIATGLRRLLRLFLIRVQYQVNTRIFGMNIHPGARISPLAFLDKTNPRGITIGKGTYVSARAVILAHDHVHGRHVNTAIGEDCFIGYGAIILPGITVHSHSIVAAGAVVTKDVGPNVLVGGNPARVIREGIDTGEFGRIIEGI